MFNHLHSQRMLAGIRLILVNRTKFLSYLCQKTIQENPVCLVALMYSKSMRSKEAQPIDVKANVVTASSEGQIIKVNLQSDNEQGISQYRAFIVKDGSRFGLDEANSISADRYQELTKGDTLLTLSKDTSGQTITSGTYQIYVLSVAQQRIRS